MFNRILLPLDRSPLAECVLPHAVAVARAFESQVTSLHVLETAGGSRWRRSMDPLNWQIRKVEASAYLHDVTLRLQQAGLAVETQILEGAAAEQIIRYTRTNAIPFTVLSSHGQSGLSIWGVSNVAHKVVLRICNSIMIVRAHQPPSIELTGLRYHRLLVPLDGSQRAESILPVVETLARTYQAQILLAHVVRRPDIPRRTPPTHEDIDLADRLVERNRTEAAQYLDELRSRLSGEIEMRLLVEDHVAETLHELVDQEKIDLVLLSSYGCAGHSRWPHGSVVSSFITYGTTPLLIMQDISQDNSALPQAEAAAQEHGRQ
ncbi:MAG TPA: universal stress protein [Anaerolineae bacterium]